MPPRDSDDCLAGLNISDDDTSGSYHDIFPYMDPLYYGGVCADMAVVPNERPSAYYCSGSDMNELSYPAFMFDGSGCVNDASGSNVTITINLY